MNTLLYSFNASKRSCVENIFSYELKDIYPSGVGGTICVGVVRLTSSISPYPELLEPASAGCRVLVMVIVPSCINFIVFSFVKVSNNNF